MDAAWLTAAPSFVAAVLLFILPGLAVRLAGWEARSILPYLLVPAISAAIVAVAANLAGLVGLPWSPLPALALTLLAAAVAFVLRRWIGRTSEPRPPARAVLAGIGGLGAAAVLIVLQLAFAFVGPDNISQTFDNIVHLNSIRFVLDTADASAVGVGRVSDIGFYPNAWHSFVALIASTTGADIPTAINATNLAIGAIVWPSSAMALSSALFGTRAASLVSAAALSTGFGAFPAMLLSFGVLYPNSMAYALLPAVLAALLILLRAQGVASITRAATVLLVTAGGLALAHPNALLAAYAIGSVLTALHLARRAFVHRTRRSALWGSGVVLALIVGGVGLWRFSRTPYEMSRWGNWQSTAQAFGEAVLLSPRSYPITLIASLLIIVGLVAVVRSPGRWVTAVVPLTVAGLLFVLASGLPSGTVIRELLTNPWYNDPYRLAALLPVAGIPVAVLGAMSITDIGTTLARRWRLPRTATSVVATLAALSLFSVAAGPNVTSTLETARETYSLTDTASLLSEDESALLSRLPTTTPADAVIAGNPWTGASLAYALGDRQVLERHIFGDRSADEIYLDEHLDEIDSDPRICRVLTGLGVTHVLDFGDQNVFNDPASGMERRGLNDLPPSPHLRLVDSEGEHARLFQVEGC